MKSRGLLATALLLAAGAAFAQKQTVCTVTVNSPDEREVFRESLPAERFDFIELVERGRSDWLASSCRKGVRCDVLLVSGHFAGTEFYSSRPDAAETLPVDEIERAGCSESCPGLFTQLKEVYLFGCDTLNATPVRGVTPEVVTSLEREGIAPDEARLRAAQLAERHGESALEHMRRLFPGVPVIYGFTAKAPYGKIAGPMLRRLFQSAEAPEVGSGAVSNTLHRLFAPASMAVTTGLRDSDLNSDYRAEACRYFDDRLAPARKLGAIHATMKDGMAQARLSLDRFEKFLASLDEAQRAQPDFAAALASIAADEVLRERFITLARDTQDPAVRVRLVSLARAFGWLDAAGQRAETMRMVGELLAGASTDFGEVDLICALNNDRSLDQEVHRLDGVPRKGRAADAAMACLGSPESRSRILAALASHDEDEVRIAQAYLRHHPITEGDELRIVALGIAKMVGSAAQARAIETLARSRVPDRTVLQEFKQLYVRAGSLAVQRAVAEAFLRWDYRGEGDLAQVLRKHRLRSTDGEDVIDILIARL